MLWDDQAHRIEAGLDGADRPTLVRWVKELLADRKARSALLQGQTRRVAYARRRLHQAATYLSGLLQQAEDEASAAWPGQLPCPTCGAPATAVTAEQQRQGHRVVHNHPDGTRCETPPPGATPNQPRSKSHGPQSRAEGSGVARGSPGPTGRGGVESVNG